MLDFLRMLAPQHTDALRPASALRRPAVSDAQSIETSPSLLDAGSQPMPPLQRARTPGAADSTEAHGAMQASTDIGLQKRAPQPAPAPACFKAPERNQLTATSSDDFPLSLNQRAAAADDTPSFLPPASNRSRNPSAANSNAHSQPAPLTQTIARSEPTADRFDRKTTRDRAATSQAPLSPTTVALYASSSSERDAAPAIHVTIDRIEVRAPATGNRAAPSKRREAAATQTLGDYLRGNGKVTQ